MLIMLKSANDPKPPGGVGPPSDGLPARGRLRLRQWIKALVWARAFYGPPGEQDEWLEFWDQVLENE